RNFTPRSWQVAAILRTSTGETVLESMYVLPGLSAGSAAASLLPSAPQSTSSSAGGSLTIVISTSEAAATSRGDFASVAPAPTNSSARDAVRFHTVTACPALTKFRAIGRPMRPSPITPILAFEPPAESIDASGQSEKGMLAAHE